jgi:hypothetical protein
VYERRHEPLVPRPVFIRRVLGHAAVALGLVGVSLSLGMAGYHVLEGLSWLDGFLNAAMLLGGMGPVNALQTSAGKLFAGLYALYAGLLFITVTGILAAPVAHRLLHRFHWEAENPEDEDERPRRAAATRSRPGAGQPRS